MRIRDSLHDDRLPDTYYTATCNDLSVYRRLEGSVRAQVCIIGGGFTGVSAALELAERGYDVALVEQNLIGWGASGRSGGQILTGPTDLKRYQTIFGEEAANQVWLLGFEGPNIIRSLVQKYSIECDLVWGGLEIARTASEFASLQARVSSLNLREVQNARLLEADEARKYVPAKNVVGALQRMDWGHCHPLNLVRAEARAAESIGAKIYEDARVERISYGDQIIVDTGHGKVTADTLILAGNAYLGGLEPRLANYIMPVGSYMVASEPLEPHMIRELLPYNYAVRGQGDASRYFHLSADNRLLFGAKQSHSGKHPKSVEKALWPKMLELFPQLKGVRCAYAWGGFVGTSENLVPQAGQLGANVYYAQAYSESGITESHIAGRIIANAIDGHPDHLNMIAAVKHEAFRGQGLFGRVLNKAKSFVLG